MTDNLLSESEWLIIEKNYEHQKIPLYETIFTLSNGYVGVRGSLEQGSQYTNHSNYFAGVFDATVDFNTELANAPCWVGIEIVADGESIHFEKGSLITYQRNLDLKKGLLKQQFRWKSKSGKITRFESYRIVHLQHKHVAIIKGFIIPENYSGTISIKSSIDGYIFNKGIGDQVKIKHFKLTESEDRNDNGVYLEMKSYNSGISVGLASKLKVNTPYHRDVEYEVDKISENLSYTVEKGNVYEFEKIVTFYSSRDVEIIKKSILKELEVRIDQGSEQLIQDHISCWNDKWDMVDIKIFGDEIAQKSLRFNIFHLVQLSNSNDDRVSVAAKALHGEGYRGHVFWDTDIFIVPFFIYTDPRAAHALLMYRYHNLSGAKNNAQNNGYKGAQFPWESADNGEEVTPQVMGDLISGVRGKVWTGEQEHHIVADVAYCVDHFYTVTGNDEFMKKIGAEIILETARFWASRVDFDTEKQLYVINKVIGPDEYHEHVDNSVFTNSMAKWNINKAFEYLDKLENQYPKDLKLLKKKIKLEDKELKNWKDIVDNMYILFDEQTGIYEEFDGYFDLEDFVISKYDENYTTIIPLDIEKRANKTKLVKQADIILLQYLLNSQFTLKSKKKNFYYYESRTTHRSSLSPSIHTIMSSEVGDYDRAYKHFMKSARIDLDDSQGNTFEGIHAAALGGTWQAIINGFAGMRIRNGRISFTPHLPKNFKKIEFKIIWKGETLNISTTNQFIQVSMQSNDENKLLEIVIGQKLTQIRGGQTYKIKIDDSN